MKRTLSWCSFKKKKKNPHKPLTDESKKKRKKNWRLSSQQRSESENRRAGGLRRGADGQHGFTRSTTRASRQMVADFWRLRLCSGGGSSIQHQAAAAHKEPALRGGCRGAPLLPRSHPLLRCSLSNNNAEMLTPISPLNYPRKCPGLKRKGEKKNVRAQKVCSRPGVLSAPAGEETSCVEMVAVCPDQLNSPRTGEGWGGVLF